MGHEIGSYWISLPVRSGPNTLNEIKLLHTIGRKLKYPQVDKDVRCYDPPEA